MVRRRPRRLARVHGRRRLDLLPGAPRGREPLQDPTAPLRPAQPRTAEPPPVPLLADDPSKDVARRRLDVDVVGRPLSRREPARRAPPPSHLGDRPGEDGVLGGAPEERRAADGPACEARALAAAPKTLAVARPREAAGQRRKEGHLQEPALVPRGPRLEGGEYLARGRHDARGGVLGGRPVVYGEHQPHSGPRRRPPFAATTGHWRRRRRLWRRRRRRLGRRLVRDPAVVVVRSSPRQQHRRGPRGRGGFVVWGFVLPGGGRLRGRGGVEPDRGQVPRPRPRRDPRSRGQGAQAERERGAGPGSGDCVAVGRPRPPGP
mmetsp:Transcript_34354/g.110339  ORF Transcript_34354/g.110339 Transcript_34354/m.110339 type:complete len:319 (-) Transcript_34354:661-1617(-)